MDVPYHLRMISFGGYDILVILIIIRMLLSLIASAIFFIEPRKCGGKNRTIHWLIAVVFLIGSFSAWTRAQYRMNVITNGLQEPETVALMFTELGYIILLTVLIAVTVYQEYNSKIKRKYQLDYECKECLK